MASRVETHWVMGLYVISYTLILVAKRGASLHAPKKSRLRSAVVAKSEGKEMDLVHWILNDRCSNAQRSKVLYELDTKP